MMKFIATAAPVWARALRRLRLLGEINDLAAERIEIWPAEMTMGLPAIELAGEFDRVKNVRPYTTLAEQAAAMTGHHTHHSATVGYRLRNALIADGTLYVGSRYEAIAKMRRRPFVFGRFREYETAQLCADVGSDLFFGRWLCDSLAKEILAEEQGLKPLNQPNRLRIHEKGYRTILAMAADLPDVALVRDLWVIDDRGYNAHHVRRFKLLRQRLRGPAIADRSPQRLIYIGRGQTGIPGRDIQNEGELQAILSGLGFTVINPEVMTPAEIRAALISARIVVGTEGSALAHAQVALPEGSAIIVIQPANRFSSAHKPVAEAAGVRFGYIVAEPHGLQLRLDIDRLRRTIELVSRVI
jgi:hypothetical protein